MLRIANKYSTFRWGFAPNPNLDTAFLSHIVLWPMYLHLQIYIYCLSSLKCSILTTLKVKHQRRKCFNLLNILPIPILKMLLGVVEKGFLYLSRIWQYITSFELQELICVAILIVEVKSNMLTCRAPGFQLLENMIAGRWRIHKYLLEWRQLTIFWLRLRDCLGRKNYF